MASNKKGSSGGDQENRREDAREQVKAMDEPRNPAPTGKPVSARTAAGRPRLKASHASMPAGAEPGARSRAKTAAKRTVIDLSSDALDDILGSEPGQPARAKRTAAKKSDRAGASEGGAQTRKAPRKSAQTPALEAPAAAGLERRPRTPAADKKSAKRTPSTGREASSQARELALALAMEGAEKKAVGIEILDVSGKIDYADFLVIMTGRSDRHVEAIATGLEEAMKRKKIVPLSVEGRTQANWVLMDYGDVVVHVFQEETRRLYDIEGLWIDAGKLQVPADERAGKTPSPQPE